MCYLVDLHCGWFIGLLFVRWLVCFLCLSVALCCCFFAALSMCFVSSLGLFVFVLVLPRLFVCLPNCLFGYFCCLASLLCFLAFFLSLRSCTQGFHLETGGLIDGFVVGTGLFPRFAMLACLIIRWLVNLMASLLARSLACMFVCLCLLSMMLLLLVCLLVSLLGCLLVCVA